MRMLILIIFSLILTQCSDEPRVNHYTVSWSEEDRNFLLVGLDSTLDNLLAEVLMLKDVQWEWQKDSSSWSIALVTEHLITHEELFYRELRVLTGLDQMAPLADSLFSDDAVILGYKDITPQNTGKAPAYLEPLGRWCSKTDAINAYSNSRKAMISFIQQTDKDLRKYYTTSGRGPTKYRDLHQLLLISIAHTHRHTQQVRNIKLSGGFPEFQE